MASFTLRLNDVYELTDGDIGLNEYPIFDEAYRETLNKKIYDHYFNREIGQETVDMFLLAMKRKMNEIMPYYNQLYKSELLEIDPFLTFSSTNEGTVTGEQSSSTEQESQATSQSGSTSTSRTVQSETPQTRLAGDGDYATAAQDAVSESGATSTAGDTTTGTQTGQSDQETRSTASGFSGSQASLLMEYRQTFLNIDVMIINELGELFMLVWSTGDEVSSDYGYPRGMHPYWGWGWW